MPVDRPAATASPMADVVGRRPKRADARRNQEALLEAARAVFSSDGVHVPLELIAKHAGVGIGTLYRNFPTRAELLEAVYVHEVEALCHAAEELAARPPWDAFAAWLDRFVAYTATKRAILEGLAGGSPIFSSCFDAIVAAGAPLLARAQEAGKARSDVTFEDVLRLVSGITMGVYADPAQRERIVRIAIDGLRQGAVPG